MRVHINRSLRLGKFDLALKLVLNMGNRVKRTNKNGSMEHVYYVAGKLFRVKVDHNDVPYAIGKF